MAKIKAQDWLTNKYENKKENTKSISFIVAKIESGEKDVELEDELLIEDYPSLKEIDLSGAKGVTKLVIENCPNVEKINLFDNQATEIVGLEKLTELVDLNCGSAQVKKIDISNNLKLGQLSFHDNEQKIEIIGFENIIEKLKFWNSIDGIAFPWEKISEKDLKEVAKELNIEEKVKDKPLAQIKGLIKGEIEKLQGIKDKVEGIPELIDKAEDEVGKVNEERLEELKKLNPGEINSLVEGLKELGIEPKDAIEEIKKLKKGGQSSESRVELLENHIRRRLGKNELQELTAQIEQIQITKQ